ncbi:MAG: efflux RND transporter periplasmic adaptor subunit [Frankia sp.]
MDASQAELTQAREALGQAKLVSPLSGTVGSVGLAAGDAVTASSGTTSSDAILIIGSHSSYQVTTAVSDSDLAKVKVGQTATATIDGSATALSGTVVSIGLLPISSTSSSTSSSASSSGSSVSYPVTISLGYTTQRIFSGSDADVAVVIAKADGAVAIPSSALRSVGNVHLVTLIRNGKATSTVVQVGAIGSTLTQITSGVRVGDKLMLANLSTPLPSSTTGTTTLRGATGGGFGGATGGGGFGGGGGTAGLGQRGTGG